MSRADVPSERFAPVAAIEADHVVAVNGSSHRDSRSTNFLGLSQPTKLTERLVHGSDEIRNLLWSHRLVPHVGADDLRGEMWIDFFDVHDTLVFASVERHMRPYRKLRIASSASSANRSHLCIRSRRCCLALGVVASASRLRARATAAR